MKVTKYNLFYMKSFKISFVPFSVYAEHVLLIKQQWFLKYSKTQKVNVWLEP